MKKILLILLVATGISLCGFSMNEVKIVTLKQTKNLVEEKQVISSHQKENLNKKPFFVCQAVEVNLPCGGQWEGLFCVSGPVLTDAQWHAMATEVDYAQCGYTWPD